MNSSKALGRMEILKLGLDVPIGSIQETFILKSLHQEKLVEYLKSVVQVNATLSAGNMVAAALSEGASSPSNDKLQNVLNYLKELLLPEYGEDTEARAERAKALLDEEQNKVYTIRKLAKSTSAEKGRVRIRRKNE